MPRLLKRPEAENDLDEIWWYIAQDSPDHADRFLDRLQERLLALADFPKMGRSRDDIQAGLRSQPVGNYLIFYFPLADGIEIVRVLHGSRDVESLL
jgi:toxin ParE1/3/4